MLPSLFAFSVDMFSFVAFVIRGFAFMRYINPRLTLTLTLTVVVTFQLFMDA